MASINSAASEHSNGTFVADFRISSKQRGQIATLMDSAIKVAATGAAVAMEVGGAGAATPLAIGLTGGFSAVGTHAAIHAYRYFILTNHQNPEGERMKLQRSELLCRFPKNEFNRKPRVSSNFAKILGGGSNNAIEPQVGAGASAPLFPDIGRNDYPLPMILNYLPFDGEIRTSNFGGSSNDAIEPQAYDYPGMSDIIKVIIDDIDDIFKDIVSERLGIVPQDQGDTNACGTTSLSMVLNYFGKPVSREQLDDEIRTYHFGTAELHLLKAARNHGICAEMYNESNFEEIKKHIDAGHGIIALVDSDERGSDNSTHYVVIEGYQEADGVKNLHIVDPAGGETYTVDYNQFVEDEWSDVDASNIYSGRDKMMLVFSDQNDLPPSRVDHYTQNYLDMSKAIGDIGNALGHFDDVRIREAIDSLAHGVWGLPTTATSFVIDALKDSHVLSALTSGLDKVMDLVGIDTGETLKTIVSGGLDEDTAATLLTVGFNKFDGSIKDIIATGITGGLNNILESDASDIGLTVATGGLNKAVEWIISWW